MMKEELISIIMPVKNTEEFLRECLDSILNQSYLNWELIAVDDGSSDSSLALLESYAAKEERIQALKSKGRGIIPALQMGYDQPSGTFITRMDSDDIMAPNKLEVMYTQLKDKGLGHIALGQVSYFSDKGIGEGFQKYEAWLNRLTARANNFNEIYKECVIPSPCWMVSRTDFEKCGGFNSDIYPEDYDLVFRFYKVGLKCIASDALLHRWRDYDSRTSRTNPHYADSSFIEIKLKYFLQLHHNAKKQLVVWGAGKKGKFVAELLLKGGIPFHWICDNPKKIGKSIYGQPMLPFTALAAIENSQSIVTVASPKAQLDIVTYFESHEKEAMHDYFFFC